MSLLVILLLLFIDHVPRFMLGDSQSYLATGIDHSYPPDRSWIYGLFVVGLMHLTRGLLAYIILQLVALWVLIRAMGQVFRAASRPLLCAGIFALGVACDPLIETYARFYMSDFSAAILFVGFVCLLAVVLDPQRSWRRRWRGLAWLGCAIMGGGAVLFRLAYAPIELASLVLCMAVHCRRAERGALRGLAAACLIPVLATVALSQANRIVFADRFGGVAFTNRLSGVFLMGVFAPALTLADMHQAGLDVTDDEVRGMRLDDYDNRINQVWGGESFWLRQVLQSHLHTDDDFDARVDAAARAMVIAALRRDPLGIATVYLNSLLIYAQPSQWHRHMASEMGQDRDLDAWFVSEINPSLDRVLTTASPRIVSVLPKVLNFMVGWYPVFLLFGVIAAVASLLGFGPARQRLAAAALLAGCALAPLYSNFAIPRYLIASVLLTWLLLPQAGAALIARARRPLAMCGVENTPSQ